MTRARFQLFLVRHGLTDWNVDGRLMGRSDVPLNERGREQAARAAEALSSVSLAAVYSSPQLRARQTAEPIAAAQGLEPSIESGVDEVWLAEAWTGKRSTELRGVEELKRLVRDPTYRSSFIEPIAEVQKRSVAAAERLREAHPGESLLVVSHGDPLRVLVAHYLGLDLEKFRRLEIANGTISVLRFSSRGARLMMLNWAPTFEVEPLPVDAG